MWFTKRYWPMIWMTPLPKLKFSPMRNIKKFAGKVDGCPTFCDFWYTKTTANMTEVQINNRAKYDRLWEQYMQLVDSKTTACAY